MRIFISGFLFSSAAATLCISPCEADQICDNGLCRKKNKCDDVTCGPNSACRNKTGACQCDDGYAQNSQEICIINPCASMSCHSEAKCSLTENSSYDFVGKCECVPGKVGDGINSCVEDSCGNDRHKCGFRAVCQTLGKDYGYDYECFCEDGYAANGSRHKNLGGSGYKTPCREFRCDKKSEVPLNENYEVVVPTDSADQEFTQTAAQQICREKGPSWDLAIMDNDIEFEKVMALTNCAENAFWIGVQKDDMDAPWETVLEENANMLNKWQIDEPRIHVKQLCVKMHLGKFKTGNCKSIHTSRNAGRKMGYICEKHAGREQEGVQCESTNDRVAPFKTLPNCPKPTCLGTNDFQIIDAWKKKTKGSRYSFLYGFSALITLEQDAFDANGGSVMLRFANGNMQGNLQTHNLNFFGFYNNNNDVLFHTKWWANGDRKDKNSVLVTVENINTPDYPEVFYWKSRVSQHNCFQSPSRVRSGKPPLIVSEIATKLKPDLRNTDDIHTISFKGGEIKRMRNN